MYRRTLFLKKSLLYKNGVVVWDPLEERNVISGTRKQMIRWARHNGWPLNDFEK